MKIRKKEYIRLADKELRLAVIVGFASVPATVFLSIGNDPSAASGVPLLLVGVIVGALYAKRPVDSRRAGVHAGLAASVGVALWQVWYLITTVAFYSTETMVVILVLMPIIVAIGVCLSVLLVTASATVADWMIN